MTRGPPHAFRVRRARPSDADNIARICEESFAEQFNHPGLVRSLLLPHSDQGGVDLAHQLRLAMMRKREAAMEHRLSRVERCVPLPKCEGTMAGSCHAGDVLSSVVPTGSGGHWLWPWLRPVESHPLWGHRQGR